MGETTSDYPIETRFQLKRYDHKESMVLGEEYRAPVTSPSEYFAFLYPDEVEQYGTPILEAKYSTASGKDRVKPVCLNIDFFAAVLGGKKAFGHDVVFFEPEDKFYFKEPIEEIYLPTSERKMEVLVSQMLLKCAEELQRNCDFEVLFTRFRSQEQTRAIVERAKAILACEETFFQGRSGQRRKVKGVVVDPTHHFAPERFIKEELLENTESILFARDFRHGFSTYCSRKNIPDVTRKFLVTDVKPIIRDYYGISFRSDLRNPYGKYDRGWRGLTLRPEWIEPNRREHMEELALEA